MADADCIDDDPLDDEDILKARQGGGNTNNNSHYSTYSGGYGGRSCWNQCFVAGTLVQTAEGSVPIEDIAVGAMVWAWDEETGDIALKEVVETYINETDELVHIYVNSEEIVCTPSHPFYSPIKGWTDAVKLRAGDILILVNGEHVVVDKVQHEILEDPVTVYNFQVEDFHTYYVSCNAILVHNACNRGAIFERSPFNARAAGDNNRL
jgi:hypothetical protein